MIILGLGGLNKDAACAVLKDGELVAAVEERKVARQLRLRAVAASRDCYALEVARLTPADVNWVALVRPFAQQIHLTLRAQFPNAQISWWSITRRTRHRHIIRRRSMKRRY